MKFLIDTNKIYRAYIDILLNFVEIKEISSFDKTIDLEYALVNLYAFEKYGIDYISNQNKINELYYHSLQKFEEYSKLLIETSKKESIDIKFILMRLKRIKKQLITYCLELLSIEWCEDTIVLMRKISNKKHCWRIVKDKKLEYSWDFIESIFSD